MAIAKDFCRIARVSTGQPSKPTPTQRPQREYSFDHASGRSIAIALFRSYLFTVLHFQQTLFSAPCIYTSNWFTCVCVFPCTCRRLTDGDQVSPEKGNSFFFFFFPFFFSPFLYTFLPFSLSAWISFRFARWHASVFSSFLIVFSLLYRRTCTIVLFFFFFFFLSFFLSFVRVEFERSFKQKQ